MLVLWTEWFIMAIQSRPSEKTRRRKAVIIGVGPERGLGAQLCKRFAAEGLQSLLRAGRSRNSMRLPKRSRAEEAARQPLPRTLRMSSRLWRCSSRLVMISTWRSTIPATTRPVAGVERFHHRRAKGEFDPLHVDAARLEHILQNPPLLHGRKDARLLPADADLLQLLRRRRAREGENGRRSGRECEADKCSAIHMSTRCG